MQDNEREGRIDIFLLCNALYLSTSIIERPDIFNDKPLTAGLQAYLGESWTCEDCRKWLKDRKVFCHLLAQASGFVETRIAGGAQANRRPIVDPRDFILTGHIQFKDLAFLANATRHLLEVNGGTLKNPLRLEDFLIPKEKVISSYVKLISLKRVFFTLSSQIQKKTHSDQTFSNKSILEDSLTELIPTDTNHDVDLQKNSQENPDKPEQLFPDLTLKNLSPVKLANVVQKIRALLADHARFTWTMQVGLFVGKLKQFILNNSRDRSRSLSKPRRKERSLDR